MVNRSTELRSTVNALIADPKLLEQLGRDDRKRFDKLSEILQQLESGQSVSRRNLKKWLTDSEFLELDEEWQAEQDRRVDIAALPSEIIEYRDLYTKATFTYNKADAFSRKGKSDTARKLFNQADSEFERALERLSEVISANPSLQSYLDRDCAWTPDSTLSLDRVGMPKVVTSRSLDNVARANNVTKIDIKLAVVRRAISNLLASDEANSVSSEDKKMHKAFLEVPKF